MKSLSRSFSEALSLPLSLSRKLKLPDTSLSLPLFLSLPLSLSLSLSLSLANSQYAALRPLSVLSLASANSGMLTYASNASLPQGVPKRNLKPIHRRKQANGRPQGAQQRSYQAQGAAQNRKQQPARTLHTLVAELAPAYSRCIRPPATLFKLLVYEALIY